MHIIFGDPVLIDQTVRANNNSLDGIVILSNLGSQIVRSILVVHMRR